MSDITKVLKAILKANKPLTAKQAASVAKVDEAKCAVYLSRLVSWGRISRAGVVRQERGRPRVLYAPNS